MVYIHSPVGNNLDIIPDTNIRRVRISLGLGRKRRYEYVYFCPSCGRDMTYLKQVPCLFCTGCSFTQYMDKVERGRDKRAFEAGLTKKAG
jgi:DNA-directed RNA polymerase subunit RPC12/RpoP